jgi:hypothetical protein
MGGKDLSSWTEVRCTWVEYGLQRSIQVIDLTSTLIAILLKGIAQENAMPFDSKSSGSLAY